MSPTTRHADYHTSYDTDFFAWTVEQASLLKTGQLSDIDIDNLVEEIETMGRSEKRALTSHLTVLIAHLLKWQFQPTLQGRSWLNTINHQRRAIGKVIKDSPSLKRFLNDADWLQEVWEDAVKDAAIETGFTQDMFPICPIWQIEQILQEGYFPDDKDVQIT